ncbi:hypothetical protein K461DRAFT_279413 [Myriangium duriaei CBS 260.36]|uniref:Rhodopsin domain-containing protein n=1 Tax=Myriangium duriaei CBS 260.36 TaxID=1168546 RepID=A0A9P4J267_9PEZI|nr:hypothetical protein K461DRAFT_279413 [Myriangium duriaei CBS 260.36]
MSSTSKDGFIAVSSTLLGLSTIAVGLRVIARKKQNLAIKPDDIFAVVALLAYLGAIACEFQLVHMRKLGYSYAELSKDKSDTATTVELALAWDVLAVCASAFIKLSALFFYRRLFTVKGMRTTFDLVSMGTAALVSVWLVVYIIMPFMQCGTHFAALYSGSSSVCFVQEPYYLSLCISNFILDLWILLLPIPSVLRLHTTTTKKISLIGVFLLAFVGLGASIARMVTYIQILTQFKKHPAQHDMGLAQTKAAYLTHLEAGISLVAVNLPSLWLLFSKVVPETALRSIRSVLSLSSLRSGKSDRDSATHVEPPTITKKSSVVQHAHRPSDASTAGLHPMPTIPAGIYGVGDLEAYKAEVYAGEDETETDEKDEKSEKRNDSLQG